MIRAQDEQIDNIGASVKVLKNLSTHIGTELEEQHGSVFSFTHETGASAFPQYNAANTNVWLCLLIFCHLFEAGLCCEICLGLVPVSSCVDI